MASAPQQSDALQWGYSLANVCEIIEPCLDAARIGSLLEIGSYRGELTERLLAWAERSGASVATVEPLPPDDLLDLANRRPELTLVQDTGIGAIEALEDVPDAIVIDGDHNYYTLSSELEAIAGKAGGDPLPLLFFHDVGWPHERRDTYYEPDRVPEDRRQPLAHNCTLQPGNPGISDGGLPYEWAAAREGGPGNGVLTAIEDFMAGREGLVLAVVPIFFGFGVLWETGADWAGEMERILSPYDRHPVLERAEANRVAHLVRGHIDAKEIGELRQQIAERDELIGRMDDLLGRMVQSSALGLAERLSRLRQRGNPIFTRAEIRDLLDRDRS